jgi:hypothetical protein
MNAIIIPEKLESDNTWKVSIPPYIFMQFVRRYAYLPGAGNFKFFQVYDYGVNISCGPHVLQADLSLKIHIL